MMDRPWPDTAGISYRKENKTKNEETKADREEEALLSASCHCLVAQRVSPSPVVALLLVMIGPTECQESLNV